jgi:hypothetical protein
MEFTVKEAFETSSSSHLHIKVEVKVNLRLAVHARFRDRGAASLEVYFVDGSALHQHLTNILIELQVSALAN